MSIGNPAGTALIAFTLAAVLGCSGGDEPIAPDDFVPAGGDAFSPGQPTPEPSRPQTQTSARTPDPALADVVGSAFYRSANNSALLLGPTLGDGASSNEPLRRVLSSTVRRADAGLSMDAAYVVSRLPAPEPGRDAFSDLIMVARNSSENVLCGVIVSDVRGFDVTGNPVAEDSLIPDTDDRWALSGSMGRYAGGSTALNTCIGSGELAYFSIPIDGSLAGELDAVRVGTLQPDYGRGTSVDVAGVEISVGLPATTIDAATAPVAYEVNDDASLVVTLQNRGSLPVVVASIRLIVLDDTGFPLDSTVARYDESTTSLAPGGQRRYRTSDLVSFPGTSSALRVRARVKVSSD